MAAEKLAERPFVYRPLEDGHIRVIDLEHCRDFKSPLRCHIRHVPLSKKHRQEEYQTLSYAWGQSGFTRSLQIQYEDGEHRCRLKIFSNLSLALRRIRSQRRAQGEILASLPLWCDAICINQDNLDEKNRQVRLMADIYSQSYRLLVWLGDIQPWRHDHALVRLLRARTVDALPAYGHQDRVRVQSLLQSTWFERRWCIQEVLKSFYINTWILFGEQVVSQSEFCGLLTRMGLLEQAGALKRLYTGSVHHSLLENLQLYGHYKCGNDLDLVYALVAISRDRALAMDPVWPDYDASPEILFHGVARRYCTNEFLVPLLVCATTRRAVDCPERPYRDLPTWVPDWRNNILYHSDWHRDAACEGPVHFCDQWMDCCDGSCGTASGKHQKAQWAAESCCKHRIKLLPGHDILVQGGFLVLKSTLWLGRSPRHIELYEKQVLPHLRANQALLTFELATTPPHLDLRFCPEHKRTEQPTDGHEHPCRQNWIETSLQHSMAFVLETDGSGKATELSIFTLQYCVYLPNLLVLRDETYRTTDVRIM